MAAVTESGSFWGSLTSYASSAYSSVASGLATVKSYIPTPILKVGGTLLTGASMVFDALNVGQAAVDGYESMTHGRPVNGIAHFAAAALYTVGAGLGVAAMFTPIGWAGAAVIVGSTLVGAAIEAAADNGIIGAHDSFAKNLEANPDRILTPAQFAEMSAYPELKGLMDKNMQNFVQAYDQKKSFTDPAVLDAVKNLSNTQMEFLQDDGAARSELIQKLKGDAPVAEAPQVAVDPSKPQVVLASVPVTPVAPKAAPQITKLADLKTGFALGTSDLSQADRDAIKAKAAEMVKAAGTDGTIRINVNGTADATKFKDGAADSDKKNDELATKREANETKELLAQLKLLGVDDKKIEVKETHAINANERSATVTAEVVKPATVKAPTVSA